MNIAIKTYGCAMNQADSEMIAGLLKKQGFEIANFENSDIVIVNTCTVKAPTENKILKKLKELETLDKDVIVSGCMPAAIPEIVNKFPDFSFIGVNVLDIVEAALCVKNGSRFIKINDKRRLCKVYVPKVRKNPVVEIIPISEGCIGNCTYCQVKLARGKLNSYPEELILKQIQNAVDEGAKEIWVTSQDNGAYGMDSRVIRGFTNHTSKYPNGVGEVRLNIAAAESYEASPRSMSHTKQALKTHVLNGDEYRGRSESDAYSNNRINLPELLNKITEIDKNFKVRAGMMNPNHVLDFLDELVVSYKNNKIYKFLHIPVQSGDDNVLKDMNRRYTANDFKKIVREFRTRIKGITISTDVIAGFPTETNAAFENTIKLIKKTKPDIVNISRYWKRGGTKAAEMKQHPGRVTKERSRIINKIFKEIALANNKKWLGWEGTVRVSEKGKRGDDWTARNFAYKPIIVKSDEDLLGKEIDVKITDASFYDFRGVRRFMGHRNKFE